MDVMIEAAPMAADVVLVEAIVIADTGASSALPKPTAVASISRPQRHSIIARGPNTIFGEELAVAA